ncbi:MAG: ArsR/SmtB family transcription factor [Acidobacteriota bacterium]
MLSDSEYKKGAQLFKALSHPIRLLIVNNLLKEERCVNDIQDLVTVSQPNISSHLNILRYSGIVDFRQEGNLRCYYLREPQKIKELLEVLQSILNT